MKYIFLLCFAWVIVPIFSFCKSGNKKNAVLHIKLTGNVTQVASVKVLFTTHYISNAPEEFFKSEFVPHKNGAGEFELPCNGLAGKIFQLVFVYKNKVNENSFDHDILDNFVVSPGDNIIMNISLGKDSIENVIFSGKGSSGYMCRWAIIKALRFQRAIVKKTTDSLGRMGYWDINNLDFIMKKIQTYQTVMDDSLFSYKNKIENFSYQVMKADIEGSNTSLISGAITHYAGMDIFFPGDSAKKNTVRTYFMTNPLTLDSFSEKVIAFSPDFVDCVYNLELGKLSFDQQANFNKISFHDLYYLIRRDCKGLLREKLLMLMIIDPFKNYQLIEMGTERSVYVTDALSLLKSGAYKARIKCSPVVRAMPGSPAFVFNLEDSAGKYITLEDLKGSVLLMDIWFSGCTGCAEFGSTFNDKVRPFITDSGKFKVISIGVDNNKTKWLKGVYSRLYTEPENINLHASQGNRDEDFFKIPLIKYYGITGCPFILLIDKNGKIVSEFSNETSIGTMIESINKVLK